MGRIAIRDANGLSHEILHTHSRHVGRGDPVVAGQLIGTMGNMGVLSDRVESGDHHVHFQIKDATGKPINPKTYWNQQGYVDPDPAPPAYIDEHQRHLRRFGGLAGSPAAAPMSSNASVPFGTSGTIRAWLCHILSAALRNAIVYRAVGRSRSSGYRERGSPFGQASYRQARPRRIRSERSSSAT